MTAGVGPDWSSKYSVEIWKVTLGATSNFREQMIQRSSNASRTAEHKMRENTYEHVSEPIAKENSMKCVDFSFSLRCSFFADQQLNCHFTLQLADQKLSHAACVVVLPTLNSIDRAKVIALLQFRLVYSPQWSCVCKRITSSLLTYWFFAFSTRKNLTKANTSSWE